MIPKCIDDCISKQNSIQYARVLVEVDVTVPLVDEVVIDNCVKEFKQQVMYGYRPKFYQ